MKIDYKNTTTYEMNALVGFPVCEYSTEWLTKNEYLTPTKCYFIKNDLKINQVVDKNLDIDNENNDNYHNVYDLKITNNTERNNIIKEIVDKNKDKKILILTKLIKHGENLNALIENSRLITSGTNKVTRKEDFNSYKLDEYNVLIGSSQIFSTGIDIPDIDIIINAGANKSDVTTIQSIGRCMRKTDDKEYAYYFDFVDDGSRYFTNSSKQRRQILEEFGHEIIYIKEIKDIYL